MLRSFRLGNHRSFRDEHELLLMPAYAKDRLALPVAAVYGANASGKSNLLDGLRFMASAVRDSFASWRPDGGVPRRPFKLDAAALAEPSVFVAEFIEAGVRYTYGFEVDDTRVREEWLYSYPEKRKRILFERSADEIKFGSTDSELKAKLEVLAGLLRPNSLLVSLAAQSNVAQVMPVYRWFVNGLHFRVDGDLHMAEHQIGHFIAARTDYHEQLVELLRAADFGISGIIVGGVESAPEIKRAERVHSELIAEAAPRSGTGVVDRRPFNVDLRLSEAALQLEIAILEFERKRRRVRLLHGENETFEFDEESAGTRSWLGLLPTVLPVLHEGGVLVIDEIDASLHPLLALRLIALFNDEATNTAGGQLIFTTHDATLLHAPFGEEVLARDEVWFVEKDEKGASSLYPLTDFKPRSEDNVQRRYLAGRYGAVPNLFEDRFAAAVRGIDAEA
ncbi:hypothetical protein Lesp02_19940 [Lentzea sp. NBRC 105346]|uniref:AAA family ATPase n=1 Tax=Lentzea sp. NBRC 105346 TaxID=3032205 RepID=UPI0024A1057F|nr:ATP-binding protein [Lentzea sp. NBRC 105346]GLZ29804.1 hypothetical protein Lesp02_19940 [Lentzea sp. NBRC 105346]